MKKAVGILLLATALIWVGLTSTGFAIPITLYFDNNDLNLGGSSQINLGAQYAGYGVSFFEVYRYIDNRDPFVDPFPFAPGYQFGISNGFVSQNTVPSTDATIFLAYTSPYFSFDWWTIGSNLLTIEAFDANGVSQGSFAGLSGSGTNALFGTIDYVQFHDAGGFVQLSNIRYDSPVPEPATLMLLGSGLLGMGGISAFRFRRKK